MVKVCTPPIPAKRKIFCTTFAMQLQLQQKPHDDEIHQDQDIVRRRPAGIIIQL